MKIIGTVQTVESLRDLAVLVSLSMSSYTPRQLDRAETKRINEQHNAKGTPLKVHRDRLSGTVCSDILTRINKAQGESRALFYSRTLPWDDSGRRMASNEAAYQLHQELVRREGVIQQLVDEFTAAWPNAMQEAKAALNGGWKPEYEEDYRVPPDEIRERFKYRLELEPMPKANDLRLDCPDAVMRRIIEQAEATITERFQAGCREAFKKLYDVMKDIHERASIPHGTPGTRDTIETHIENLAALANVLPSLNIARDAELDRLTKEARKLLSFDLPPALAGIAAPPSTVAIANRLKDDKTHRADTARAAGKILDDIRQYLGGAPE